MKARVGDGKLIIISTTVSGINDRGHSRELLGRFSGFFLGVFLSAVG